MTDTEHIVTLAERTGAGLLDCKAALRECNGDIDKAAVFIVQRGRA